MAPSAQKRHNFIKQHTAVDGKAGYFYICEYCGQSAGEVGPEAYQEQVDSLPASGYNSAGRLIWQPSLNDIDFNSCAVSVTNSFNGFSSLPYSNGLLELSFDPTKNALKLVAIPTAYYASYTAACVQFAFVLPIDGSYRLIDSFRASVRAVGTDGVISERSYSYRLGSFWHYPKGITFRVDRDFLSYGLSGDFSTAVSYWYFPFYEIIPDTAIDTTLTGQYGINSRPTAITGGNYGIVGDNGQITTVTNNNQIINETNNTYYNPATGQTQAITDWTYNYDGRIYDITLDTGDKVSVEYGDNNITITENTVNEGGTTVNNYTIYYILNGSGDNPSPTPGPTTCPHAWAETSRTDPTCTAPGKAVSVCSKCGQTKTDPLPALGHDWKVVRTVPTEYDEAGIQTQAGYTLYECTRCGEQYKDTDSTGPPGNDPPEDGGLIDFLNGIIQALSDNLSGAVELVLRFFREIPKLFDGFTGFLAAVFPFLPDEIMLLLTFGMAALVFVGVIKAIRR